MIKKIAPIISLLLAFSLGAEAQKTTDGRIVKRITFDREQVNIEYADSTYDYGVDAAIIKHDKATTGITAVKPQGIRPANHWYTIDGRSLQSEPQQKGVYIVRSKRGIKKTIKK